MGSLYKSEKNVGFRLEAANFEDDDVSDRREPTGEELELLKRYENSFNENDRNEYRQNVVLLGNIAWKVKIESFEEFYDLDIPNKLIYAAINDADVLIRQQSWFILRNLIRYLPAKVIGPLDVDKLIENGISHLNSAETKEKQEILCFLTEISLFSEQTRDQVIVFLPFKLLFKMLAREESQIIQIRICELVRNLAFHPMSQEQADSLVFLLQQHGNYSYPHLWKYIAQTYCLLMQNGLINMWHSSLIEDILPLCFSQPDKATTSCALSLLENLYRLEGGQNLHSVFILPELILSPIEASAREACVVICRMLEFDVSILRDLVRNRLLKNFSLLFQAKSIKTKSAALPLLYVILKHLPKSDLMDVLVSDLPEHLFHLFELKEDDITTLLVNVFTIFIDFVSSSEEFDFNIDIDDLTNALLNIDSPTHEAEALIEKIDKL